MDPSIEVGVVMKQLFSRNSVDCDVARNAPRNYRADQQGSVAMFFALSIIPIMGLIAFGIDYSRENAVKAKVYAAVDAAALSATSMALNGASATVAQNTASQALIANLSAVHGLNYTSDSAPTINVSKLNGIVTTNVSYSGTVTNNFSTLIGRPNSPVNVKAGASGGSFVGASGSGQYYGSGSLSEDPVVRGADGSYQLFTCDYSGNTWYNLLSDANFQINANCTGNSSWSEYYKVSILAGTHVISITPTLTSVGWYGTVQTGEAWAGAITIDGVAYPAQSGSNTYLSDASQGVTVKVVVGQPGVAGSSANYALITTGAYSVSVAYDSDDDFDGSTGLAATFGFADIQIAANNAGKCGVPGGTWGGTLGRIDDFNANDFIVSGPTAQASQFTWNCTTAAQANAKVRLTN